MNFFDNNANRSDFLMQNISDVRILQNKVNSLLSYFDQWEQTLQQKENQLNNNNQSYQRQYSGFDGQSRFDHQLEERKRELDLKQEYLKEKEIQLSVLQNDLEKKKKNIVEAWDEVIQKAQTIQKMQLDIELIQTTLKRKEDEVNSMIRDNQSKSHSNNGSLTDYPKHLQYQIQERQLQFSTLKNGPSLIDQKKEEVQSLLNQMNYQQFINQTSPDNNYKQVRHQSQPMVDHNHTNTVPIQSYYNQVQHQHQNHQNYSHSHHHHQHHQHKQHSPPIHQQSNNLPVVSHLPYNSSPTSNQHSPGPYIFNSQNTHNTNNNNNFNNNGYNHNPNIMTIQSPNQGNINPIDDIHVIGSPIYDQNHNKINQIIYRRINEQILNEKEPQRLSHNNHVQSPRNENNYNQIHNNHPQYQFEQPSNQMIGPNHGHTISFQNQIPQVNSNAQVFDHRPKETVDQNASKNISHRDLQLKEANNHNLMPSPSSSNTSIISNKIPDAQSQKSNTSVQIKQAIVQPEKANQYPTISKPVGRIMRQNEHQFHYSPRENISFTNPDMYFQQQWNSQPQYNSNQYPQQNTHMPINPQNFNQNQYQSSDPHNQANNGQFQPHQNFSHQQPATFSQHVDKYNQNVEHQNPHVGVVPHSPTSQIRNQFKSPDNLSTIRDDVSQGINHNLNEFKDRYFIANAQQFDNKQGPNTSISSQNSNQPRKDRNEGHPIHIQYPNKNNNYTSNVRNNVSPSGNSAIPLNSPQIPQQFIYN